ncbi:MAG: transposase [Parcubacteria group bacterium]|jgi:hypothetical protein
MQYGIDYGMKKAVVVTEKGKTITLDDVSKKIEFVNSLNPEDAVYLEFGAGADKFALSCVQKDISVFRIPTTVFSSWRNGNDKKDDAKLMLELAQNTPELFYPVAAKDVDILKIGLMLQKYYVVQDDIRKPAEQRLFLTMADDLLVRGEPVADLEKALRKQIAEHPMFLGAIEEEKKIYKEMEKFIRKVPLYQAIFEPIKGVGPVIAGRIMYGIQDIRRFSTPAKLKNYSGYGFFEDGSAQRRKKGEVFACNKFLKQGVFLFTNQVNRGTNPEWKERLIQRKAFERSKFPEVVIKEIGGEKKKYFTDGHIHLKGCRYIGQKFLEYIWREWRRFEGI